MSFAFNIPFAVEKAPPPGPVFHFIHGKAYSTGGNIVDAEGWSICTDFIQVLTRETLTWKWGNATGYGRYLIEYDSAGNYAEYFGSNNATGKRTVTLQKAETTQIRFCVMTALLDDCFVFSETRGIYLWKGANVI